MNEIIKLSQEHNEDDLLVAFIMKNTGDSYAKASMEVYNLKKVINNYCEHWRID